MVSWLVLGRRRSAEPVPYTTPPCHSMLAWCAELEGQALGAPTRRLPTHQQLRFIDVMPADLPLHRSHREGCSLLCDAHEWAS